MKHFATQQLVAEITTSWRNSESKKCGGKKLVHQTPVDENRVILDYRQLHSPTIYVNQLASLERDNDKIFCQSTDFSVYG